MKTWSCLLCPLLFTTVLALGAGPPQKLPEADIQAFLAAEQMPTLPITLKGRVQKDYDAAWIKWTRRVILDPCAVRLGDAPAKEKALRVAADGMEMIGEINRDHVRTTKLAGDCAALVKEGVDDPLIYWLQSWAVYHDSYDLPGAKKLFKQAYDHPRLKDAPGALRFLMLWKMDQILKDPGNGSQLIEAARLSIEDGLSYKPEDEEILVENMLHIFTEKYGKTHKEELREICELPQLTNWEQLVLTAIFDQNSAWVARGHEYADKVNDAAWKQFAESMEKAQRGFVQAWELRPDRPQAAIFMVTIRASSGLPGEGTPRDWLDRAVEARFDCMDAYERLLFMYLPQWGGSEAKMLGLGLACALTQRYDTKVPYFFFDAMEQLARRTETDWKTLFREPLIAAVAVALSKQRVQDSPTEDWKENSLGLLAVYAWVCGDYKTAGEALAQLHGKFRRGAQDVAKIYHTDEAQIRIDAMLSSAGVQDLWEKANDAIKGKNPDVAIAAYEAMMRKSAGPAADMAATRLAALKVEKELHQGGWVALRAEPKLAGWEIRKGDWEGTPEGDLINHGAGTTAFIMHWARVGVEFQIRGEFESPSGVGVVLGQDWEKGREYWVTCLQQPLGKGTAYYILEHRSRSTVQEAWTGGGARHSTFLITCHEGCITYEVNGRTLFKNCQAYSTLQPYNPVRLMPEGHVGFCHNFFAQGNTLRVSKLEVRLLSSDFKEATAPAPPQPPPGQRIATSEDLLGYLEGSVWSLNASSSDPQERLAFIHSSRRDFWVPGDTGENHLAINATDAKTLQLDGKGHTLTFNDDHTQFDLTDWPKKGANTHGSLKSKPPAAAGPARPFDPAGTQWRRKDSLLDFYDNATWHEAHLQSPRTGLWKPQSDNEFVMITGDNNTQTLAVSDDGQTLTRNDGLQWQRVP